MTKQIFSTIKVITLAVVVSFGVSHALAWTAPASVPPLGNVDAPINTGSAPQTKTGTLTVGDIISTGDVCITGKCLSAIIGALPTGTDDGQTVRWDGASLTWRISDPGDILVNGITVGVGGSGSGDNTAMGYCALCSNITGTDNTSSGFASLLMNSTGSRNTATGGYALYDNEDGSNNTANGYDALYSTYGGGNTAVGTQSLFYNTSGSYNTGVGIDSLRFNGTGTYNTAIGAFTSMPFSSNLTNATAIGAYTFVDASNKVRIGNTAVTVIGGQVAWSNLSDARLKKDVVDYTHGLDFITRLRPVSFKFTTDATNQTHNGFIAQEVEATDIPFYGINKPATKDGYYSLSYAEFVVPLVNSVKELKAENDKLKADNVELLLRIEKIESRLK
ncbi:MAG: hypothetical protein A2747_02755 [Candidatus Yonathbacteria bacterium RIFCSPHIGHO2_01_FULL_44_41]|uniref:Peptidase S74 domain-containing protein n=1 Tax=Candidatus Yonathbacteria bacterium RIFCSPHIGHO2_02_FULL_44_14 TaxID=1802724 RepID=A0A1G2S795_9BACT|nr:MAG: hypothetical protein A2747_02755 [Candidatus Yonathbacteria bacterium RIFCSPHIGHO2_01_FULL_44_41]OHA80569.1 MAG: hypothetical protein A3D51_00635 [Candidatus Yonathbacteria bacterium RIFCSPHIGHO2_02_FULL_44_14]OHA82139.1 MAG: hypothetical protein A3B06_01360 [Candidatus Yonathbacteria bacterium RIFCSPLOWO2_01_FULL_43_20]